MSGLTEGVLIAVSTAAMLEVGGLFARYLLQILLARQLGPTGYGSYSFNFSWIQLLAIPASLGFTSSVMRFIPTYLVNEQLSYAAGFVRRAYQTLIVSTTLVAIFATLFSTLFTSTDGLLIAWVFLLVPPTSVVLVQAEMIRAASGIIRARIFNAVIQPILVGGFALLVVYFTGQLAPSEALLGLSLALMIGVVFQGTVLYRSLPSSVRSAGRQYETSLWLRVSLALLLVKGFQLLLNQTDIILIGLILGAREAGLYAAAAKTAVLTNVILSIVNLAVGPELVRTFARADFAKLESLLRAASKFTFAPSLLIGALMVLFGRQILGLFGPGFSGAYVALAVLSCGRLVNALTGPVGTLLNLTGKERLTAATYGVAAALNLILNLLLIPSFGIAGAAISTSLTMVLWNAALGVLVWRQYAILPWPLRRIRSG